MRLLFSRSASPHHGFAAYYTYQALRENGRGVQIANTIMDKARICNLDKDINIPEIDAGTISLEERDNIIGAVYSRLMEIESRLLPCGLHVVGKPPTAEEAVATLVNIASLDSASGRYANGKKKGSKVYLGSSPKA